MTPHELNDPENVRAHRRAIAARRFASLQADAAQIGLVAVVIGVIIVSLIPGVIVGIWTAVALFLTGYILGLTIVSRMRKAKRSR